jgi:hypothetical protein
MLYLEFLINNRTMTVSWPLYKLREHLYDKLYPLLSLPKNKRHLNLKQAASIIGYLRPAIQISQWGVYLSFALAANLKRAGKNAMSSHRLFWSKGKIRLNQAAIRDIQLLLETLLAPEEDLIWTRLPIALLVPREPTHWLKSNASYAGIGGWTLSFGTFMWRIMWEALVEFGFHMKTIGVMIYESTDPTVTGLHINPLKFLAIIITSGLPSKSSAWAISVLPDQSSPFCPTIQPPLYGCMSQPRPPILNSSN